MYIVTCSNLNKIAKSIISLLLLAPQYGSDSGLYFIHSFHQLI